MLALLIVIQSLPSEQRSRKRKRLNFMPTDKRRTIASAISVLKVALYDNQKSKHVSVGCTNIGIFWYCCTAFQSNSNEQSAFLLTSGFLVNQPILTLSLGRAKAGGGPRTLP